MLFDLSFIFFSNTKRNEIPFLGILVSALLFKTAAGVAAQLDLVVINVFYMAFATCDLVYDWGDFIPRSLTAS